jgi:hypothetical protein
LAPTAEAASSALGGPGSLAVSAAATLGKGIFDIRKHFKATMKNGEIVGRVVACLLTIGYPFATNSISLIGFSLGTHVIKHLLLTLNELGKHDLI